MSTTTANPPVAQKFEITVIYNGISKPLSVNENEAIQAVLQHAIALFGPLPQPHTLALFTESGTELQDNTRVQEDGVKPGDRLLLRPSTVRGG